MQVVEARGGSLDEARRRLAEQLQPGAIVVEEEVVDDGAVNTVSAEGPTDDSAMSNAIAAIPQGAIVESRTLLNSSMREEYEIRAEHQGAAETMAKQQHASRGMKWPWRMGDSVRISQVRQPRGGIFGLFHAPGTYRVVVSEPAKARVTYRPPVTIRARLTTVAERVNDSYLFGMELYRGAQPKHRSSTSFDRRNLTRAFAQFASCVALDADHFDAVLMKAQCAYDAYDQDEMKVSTVELHDLTRRCPRLARAYDLLGSLCYATRKDLSDEDRVLMSIAHKKKALEIDPAYASDFGIKVALGATGNSDYRDNTHGIERELAEIRLKKAAVRDSDEARQIEPLRPFESMITTSADAAATALCGSAILAVPPLTAELIRMHYTILSSEWASARLYHGTREEVVALVKLNLERLRAEPGFQSFAVTALESDQAAQISAGFLRQGYSFQPIRVWRSDANLFVCGNAAFGP